MFKFLFPLLLIGAAIGGFYFFTDPTYQQIKNLQAEKQSYQDALDNSKKLQSIRDELLNKYNAFPSPAIDRLEKMLPNNVDNVRLVLEIDQIAARYGMTIRNIKFSSNDQGQDRDLIGKDDSLYGTLPLEFTAVGFYPNFIAFIADIERSLRIVDISNISFAADDNLTSPMQFAVKLKTYWLK